MDGTKRDASMVQHPESVGSQTEASSARLCRNAVSNLKVVQVNLRSSRGPFNDEVDGDWEDYIALTEGEGKA